MKKLGLLGFFVCLTSVATASHLRCGYIVAEPLDCPGKKYRITITVYTNTGSTVSFGGDGVLNFGDGTTMIVPEVSATPRPDLGVDIGIAKLTIEHTYQDMGDFLISYAEPNRNGGVLNMDNSFFTLFYTETKILINNQFGCTTSPVFLTPAILHASKGTEFTYSIGASSDDDNLITYELVTPFRDRNTPVVNYISPENLKVNYLSGLLTWDTKFRGNLSTPGEYNFAVQVNQHVKTGDAYTPVGYVRIDFQVILEGDVSNPVSLQDNENHDAYNRFFVPVNLEKKIKVFSEVTESASLEAFSELADQDEFFSFTTYDSTHEQTDFKVGVLTIKSDASIARENPYLITVRSTSGGLGSDMNYLIYTNEIPGLPVIIPTVITSVEKGTDGIEVYPNPATEKVTIRINRPGQSEVVLYTMQGSHIKTGVFETQVDVMLYDLPPGVYICDIRRNNISLGKIKLIKTQ